MTIQGKCPGCGKGYRVPSEAAGRAVTCPACAAKFNVPAAEASPEEPAAAEPADDGGYQLADSPAEPAPAPAPKVKRPREAAAPANEPSPAEHDPFALAGSAPTPSQAPARKKAKKPKASGDDDAAPKRARREKAPVTRSYLWFALALVPLVISLFVGNESIEDRFARAAESDPAAVEVALAGGRLPGSHLSRDTILHWPYAFVAGVVMLLLTSATLPRGKAHPGMLVGIALAVAFGGMCLLSGLQMLAAWSTTVPVRGGIVGAILGIPRLIAFSYRAALDPESGFLMSAIGFTLGVGLCEELIKALPVLAHFRGEPEIDWQEACGWGAACGIGFGVAEGVIYSADFYNGIATWDAYLVRFVSCVALHAIWSATVGILAWQNQGLLEGDLDWVEYLQAMAMILGGPMVLHGLYDTFLKKEMPWGATLTALASFVFLAVLVELHSDRAPGLRAMLEQE